MDVTPWRAWSAAIGVAAVALLTELLPVVFGTGANAKLDWSLTYVTLRFVLLPPACLVLVFCIVVGAFRPASRRECLLSVSALVVPVGYLVLLWLHPVFLFV